MRKNKTVFHKKIGILLSIMAVVGTLVMKGNDKRKDKLREGTTLLNKVLNEKVPSTRLGSFGEDTMILARATKEISKLSNYQGFFKSNPNPLLVKIYDKSCECCRILDYNKPWIDFILTPNGIPDSLYMGSIDADFWPDSLVRGYTEQDMEVLNSGKLMDFRANVVMDDEVINGRFQKWTTDGKLLFLMYIVE